MSEKMENITERLNAARERQDSDYFNGFIHAYCDNHNCTGRRFQIQIKTYAAPDPVSVRCPLCGEIAIADRYAANVVETLGEHEKRLNQEARCRVNVQLYLKKNSEWSVPVSVMFDDSLPE